MGCECGFAPTGVVFPGEAFHDMEDMLSSVPAIVRGLGAIDGVRLDEGKGTGSSKD